MKYLKIILISLLLLLSAIGDNLGEVEVLINQDLTDFSFFFDTSLVQATYTDDQNLLIEYGDHSLSIDIASLISYDTDLFNQVRIDTDDESLILFLKKGQKTIAKVQTMDDETTSIYFGKQNPDTTASLVYIVEHVRSDDSYLALIANKQADLVLEVNDIGTFIQKDDSILLATETILKNELDILSEQDVVGSNFVEIYSNADGVLQIKQYDEFEIDENEERHVRGKGQSKTIEVVESEEEYVDIFEPRISTVCEETKSCFEQTINEESCHCVVSEVENELKWVYVNKDEELCDFQETSALQDAEQEDLDLYSYECCQSGTCTDSLCAYVEKPNLIAGSDASFEDECTGSWCCDQNDQIYCYEESNELVVEVTSSNPYVWVITKLNDEIQEHDKRGRGVSSVKRLDGPVWKWTYHIDTSDLEDGDNALYFLRDATEDKVRSKTQLCLQSAFSYDGTNYADPSDDFEFPEIEAGEVDKPQKPGNNKNPNPSNPDPSGNFKPANFGDFKLGGQVVRPGYGQDIVEVMDSSCMQWVKHQIRFSPGDDPQGFDHFINGAHQAGFKVLLSVIDSSPHSIEPTQSYFDTYADFVGHLASMGADAIEVWNEPNIDREWPSGAIEPRIYNQLLKTSYNKIKEKNQNTMVIMGAPAPTGFFGAITVNGADDNLWIQGLKNEGVENYADCIGMHFNQGATSPTQTNGHPSGDHYSYYYKQITDLYASTFQKPICITELGYISADGYGSLSSNFAWGKDISLQEHATWLTETVDMAIKDSRVNMLIVWNVDFDTFEENDPMGGYAIIRPDGSCPACSELGQLCS